MSSESARRFLASSGAAGPLRLSVERPGEGSRHYEVSRPFARVGREAKSDLCLDHAHISRTHAYLQVVGGRLLCVDLASRTGTHWRTGQSAWGWIDETNAVAIGPFRVRLSQPLQVVPGTMPPLDPFKSGHPASEPPGIALEFLSAQTGKRSARLQRPITLIGRSPLCRVRFDDKTVAPVHCSLVLTGGGAYLVNLTDRGTTRVDGKPVLYTRLEEGVELRIGRFTCRVRYLPERQGESSVAEHPGQSPSDLIVTPEVTLPSSVVGLPAFGQFGLPKLEFPEPGGLLVPNGASADGLVRALVVQMTSFHQQMFEQNQQTISMIVQLFSRMHREHLDLVREELGRLAQLTEEFRIIQRELNRMSADRGNLEQKRLGVSAGMPGDDTRASGSKPETAVTASKPDLESGLAADITAAQSTADRDSAARGAVPPRAVPDPAPDQPAAAPAGSAPTSPVPETITNPEEVTVWLVERMAAIEAERQTLWQRVFNAFKLP